MDEIISIPEWYQLARSHGARARRHIRSGAAASSADGAYASEDWVGIKVVYPPGVPYQVINADMRDCPDLKGRKGLGLLVEISYDYDDDAYTILIHNEDLELLGLDEEDVEEVAAGDDAGGDGEEENEDDDEEEQEGSEEEESEEEDSGSDWVPEEDEGVLSDGEE